jgi:hypothetical protein
MLQGRYGGQVTEARLRERLVQVHAIEADDPYSQELARAAIVGSRIEGVVCSRVDVAGISRCATFEKFYALLYGVGLDGKSVKPARGTQSEARTAAPVS